MRRLIGSRSVRSTVKIRFVICAKTLKWWREISASLRLKKLLTRSSRKNSQTRMALILNSSDSSNTWKTRISVSPNLMLRSANMTDCSSELTRWAVWTILLNSSRTQGTCRVKISRCRGTRIAQVSPRTWWARCEIALLVVVPTSHLVPVAPWVWHRWTLMPNKPWGSYRPTCRPSM